MQIFERNIPCGEENVKHWSSGGLQNIVAKWLACDNLDLGDICFFDDKIWVKWIFFALTLSCQNVVIRRSIDWEMWVLT